MMAPKKAVRVMIDNDFPKIVDLSQLRNLNLFKTVVRKHPADIHFFWYIGLKDIEKVEIKSPFRDYRQSRGKYKALGRLTNIKLKNNVIHLLEPLGRDYVPKQHDIEAARFKLSKYGRKIWIQAREDGLWKVLEDIPSSHCVEFQSFEEYVRTHLFFSHKRYLIKLEEFSSIVPVQQIKIPKRKRKEERNGVAPYVAREEKIVRRRSLVTPKTDFDNLLKFDNIKILRRLKRFLYGSSMMRLKQFMTNYLLSMKHQTYLKKSQKKQFYDALHQHLKLLARKGHVKLTNTFIDGTKTHFITITSLGIQYYRSKSSDRFEKLLPDFIYRHAKLEENKTKKETLILKILIESVFMLVLLGLIFFFISILEGWFGRQYHTPISILRIYFPRLTEFIYMSSITFSLSILSPAHFYISIVLLRRKRWHFKLIKVTFYSLTALSVGFLISNIIFLFGV